jgi:hypothetical protein
MKKAFTHVCLMGFLSSLALAFVACGPSKFSGDAGVQRKANPNPPDTGNASPLEAPISSSLTVQELSTQLRASNVADGQPYGVIKLDLAVRGLVQGQRILSLSRAGMSDDIKITGCNTQTAPVAKDTAASDNTYTQTVTCFLIFKGLKNQTSLHRLYPGIERVVKVGTTTKSEEKRASVALCVVSEDDATDPCTEKSGRIVLKDIVVGKSASDLGHEVLPFPDDATIAADIGALTRK